MKLQDLKKAELIAIIRKLEENSICEMYVQSVLINVQRKSVHAAIEEGEKASAEYLSLLNDYNELLEPYNGGELTDIPQETLGKLTDISKRLNAAKKKMHDAYVRYKKIAGI